MNKQEKSFSEIDVRTAKDIFGERAVEAVARTEEILTGAVRTLH